MKQATSIVLASTILLSGLTGATASAAASPEAPTKATAASNVLTASATTPSVQAYIGNTFTPVVKPATKTTYKFSVTKARVITVVVALDKKDIPEGKTLSDLVAVTIKGANKKATGKEVLHSYGSTAMVAVETNLPKGEYTAEITGLMAADAAPITLDMGILGSDSTQRVTFSKVKSSKPGALPVGVTTTLSPVVTSADVLHKVELYDAKTKKYKVLRNYSATAAYNFKQAKPGKYKVRMSVKTEQGKVTARVVTVTVVKAVTPKALKVTNYKASAKPKAMVGFTASATGSNVVYGVTYKKVGAKASVKATTARAFATNKKVAFKAPAQKGVYNVTIVAKQHNGAKSIKTTKRLTVK